jgi:hypothetical protein
MKLTTMTVPISETPTSHNNRPKERFSIFNPRLVSLTFVSLCKASLCWTMLEERVPKAALGLMTGLS